MNARLLVAFLCIAMGGTGCIIVDNDGPDHGGPCCTPTPPPPPPVQVSGDLTFLWTFANVGAGRCSDVPDVKNIRITIPGEKLHNGGVYACNTLGTDGIVLHDFAPKSYGYTLEALSYDNRVLYQASGNFAVNGDTRVNVNLTPKGGQSSFAYISWSFEANTSSSNPDCNQAGATHVDVRIDGGEWTRLQCEKGIGTNQVSSPYLAPGAHTIELVGVRVSGSGETPYYYRKEPLTTQAGSPIFASFKLMAVGGMTLSWDLRDGSLARTCAQAGVSELRVNMRNLATNKLVYGEDGDAQPCTDPHNYLNYRFLPPGDYRVFIRGVNGSRIAYSSENHDEPVLTVKAFVQKTEAQATILELQRKY
ncbi:hypothetical protein [Melittangium boletus]|uniref:Uncharacterized protein n=1 Tax=Melittangium boletus DSM 14713 TaxID=1294270 RepID=A0A250I9S9_9BACT|nr:hypothetical protein [Melittangium boletus]ATB27960.1 hypothetical protein MEBOL_001405 [Melittangium boletus DSM 14713]